jgi:hypothetical protein
MEIGMNECEFMVGIGLEVEEFVGEVVGGGANLSWIFIGSGMQDEIMKTEGDVGGGLNDSLNDLCDIFIFDSEQLIAANGLFKANKCHLIGNKRFAILKIDGNPINREAFQIMKSQMRD